MTTLFISDLHLQDDRPELTARFLRFLEGDARRASALYILGDLFESWVGDDDDAPPSIEVEGALRALVADGVPTYFMHGNRDFLIGAAFARRTGVTLLPDPSVVAIEGTPTLLVHGDTLCTADVAYQRFRSQVRDVAWQREFLARPLAERRAFAAHARAESRKHTGAATMEIMDVADDAVVAAFRAHGTSRMIHGHTHRPAVHRHDVDGDAHSRIVLADWDKPQQVLSVTGTGIARYTV